MNKHLRLIVPVIVAALFGLAATLTLLSASASSTDEMWQDIDQTALRQPSGRAMPQAYRTLRLDTEALDQLLARAPQESPESLAQSPVVISLPLPDGGFTRFRVVESPIMEPALAAQFPQIRTYSGQGIDDPAATMRCDLSPRGFHAIALGTGGAIYVEPYAPDEQRAYISYYQKDYLRGDPSWGCSVLDHDQDQTRAGAASQQALSHGGTLRTYRLAVAATGEYTGFHGGTLERALAAIVTTINRVNAIYQREVAVRLTLVAGQARIIYTNPNNDPYTNDDGRQLLDENQRNLDAVIGSNNYDIGHVFSTRGGGLAQLSSVCNSARKAMGQTGSPSPVGDPFDVDYVAHEIGHQFGGSHTFNGAAKKCSGNRTPSAAYEPGSGSTIQAYAGICGEQDLQPNTDPYFHVKSLEEITSFITNGGGAACGVPFNTGNAPPAVNAGAEFTIPARTPFTLVAAGSDPNGHPLTFAWEQYDLGPISPPDTDDGFRPIFRSFAPRPEASRTFPRLADILANRETYGESLPATTRGITFQVTARDNQAQGGAIASAATRVNVQAGGGPFAVTRPNASIAWAGGSTETVTWDVANTNAAPINCANVKITLSTDGGNTFPIVLAESTPNDGSHSVLVPNTATTSARIKVEAVGNIFFDISNANLTITRGGGGGNTIALASGVPQTGSIPAPAEQGQGVISQSQYTIQTPGGATQLKVDLNGNQDVDLYVRFGQPVTISNGAPQADFISESPTGNETITISPASSPALQAGTYYIAVSNFGPGAANFTLTAAVTISSGIEGDVAPRPQGNGTVTITDWVQIGRFVAGQDTPSGSEFQRADTAPRESRGNGSLTITDWVQAGRYAAGVDLPTPAAGPAAPGSPGLMQSLASNSAGARQVRMIDAYPERGEQKTMIIALDAEGDENALGFSLSFDPAQLRFVSAAAGDGASGATLNVNISRASRGQLGLALALPAGRTIAPGPRQIAILTFASAPNGNAATAAIGFGDLPVPREVSDANARALPASFAGCPVCLSRSWLGQKSQ
ncbi:MAG: reprolysin-like metallopeptidase [Blastocatellia bacterium]